MTPFMKYWITSTCAPETIQLVRESPIGAFLVVRNEDKSKELVLIEDTVLERIVGIGKTYQQCSIPVSYSYSGAVHLIAKEFELLSIVCPV